MMLLAAGCWLQLLAAGAVAAAVASPIIAQFGLFFRGVLKLASRGGPKIRKRGLPRGRSENRKFCSAS